MPETPPLLNLSLSDDMIKEFLQSPKAESFEGEVMPYHPLAFQSADKLEKQLSADIHKASSLHEFEQEGEFEKYLDHKQNKLHDLEPELKKSAERRDTLSSQIESDADFLSAQEVKPIVSLIALKHCKQLFDGATLCADMGSQINESVVDVSANITDVLNGKSPDTPPVELGSSIRFSMRF